jgi:hypothetical protein
MHRYFSLRVSLALALILLAFHPNLYSQDLASVVGTVTDPTGAAVPDVSVTITNQATGASRATFTNDSGSYSVPALPVGTYTVRSQHVGFQTYAKSGIVVNVRDVLRVDIQLELGAVTQQVNVSAQAVQLQTESGEVNDLISGRQVASIAVNGRNFLQLATLTTGASSMLPSFNTPVGVTANASIAFNGEQPDHNIWYVDGQENYDRGCGGCITVLPSIDAIQEFKVQASNMSTDTGFGTGGHIQVEIKSGTRDFHGSVYEFLRNDKLDAASFFANLSNTPKPALKFNNFGYNFGGPFYIPGHYNTDKSKTFFFWSQEWRRLRQGTTIFAPAIPGAWRSGDFSSYGSPILDRTKPVTLPDGSVGYTPFPKNAISSGQLDANALILGAPNFIFPLPNTPDGQFFAASPSVPTNVREEILRVDHRFSDKTYLMFHYIRDTVDQTFPTTQWSGDTYPTIGTQFINPPQSVVLKLTRSISSSLLNEFMVAYQRQPLTLNPVGTFRRPSNLTIKELFPDNRDNRIPTINLFGPALGVNYDPSAWPWYNVSNTWTWRDELSKSLGNHSLKFGGEYMRFLKEQDLFGTTQGAFTFNGGSTAGNYLGADGKIHSAAGNEFADFMLGRAFSYNELQVQTRPAYVVNNFGLWFGDTWKLRPGLSLDYGVRWEGMPHVYEIHNNVAAFRPSLYNPNMTPQLNSDGTIVPGTGNLLNGMALAGKNGIPPGLVENHWKLFEPRFGFAWQPLQNAKTVIRGGYGIFYERIQGNDIYNVAPNPPFSATSLIFNTTLSNPGGAPGTVFPSSTQNFDPRYLEPYSQQYSFGVQREISPQTIFSVMYVGSHGTHEQLNRDINQPLAPAGSRAINAVRPFLGYGDIGYYENSTSSSYNSLQASLHVTNWHGLSSGLAYTWSHSIDFVSGDVGGFIQNAYNVAAERGNSDFDRRQMLVFNYVYDLPVARNLTGAAGKALGGWTLSGITTFQTGLPVSVTFPGDAAQIGGAAPYRANLIANPNSGAVTHTRVQWFNAAAFAPVPTGSFGNAGRNVVWGQGLNNWDLSIFKSFSGVPFPRTTEGAHLQIRVEFFNAFNHTQFNGYFTSFGGAGFGGANSTRDPRVIQMGLKLLF